MYNRYGKEKTDDDDDDDDDVKGMYILLSRILVVVTSTVIGITISALVHVRCNLYPKTHPFLV